MPASTSARIRVQFVMPRISQERRPVEAHFFVAGLCGIRPVSVGWLRCLVRLPPRQFTNDRAGENGRRLAWYAMGTAPLASPIDPASKTSGRRRLREIDLKADDF